MTEGRKLEVGQIWKNHVGKQVQIHAILDKDVYFSNIKTDELDHFSIADFRWNFWFFVETVQS